MVLRAAVAGTLFLTLLAGCASTPIPTSNLLKMTRSFAERLRWQDIDVVAAYVVAEEREAFRANWKGVEDLHVVETRVTGFKMVDEETAEVTMDIDYYLLPSATVKRIDSQQVWEYRAGDRLQVGSWELASGMPMLPVKPDSPQKDE